MVNILKYFGIVTPAKEKCRLVWLNIILTGKLMPIAKTDMENLSVITIDVVILVSSTLEIVLNGFIPFSNFPQN